MTSWSISGLRLGVAAVCLMLVGCSVLFIPNPSDLQLTGLEVIDLRNQPDASILGGSPEPRRGLVIRFTTSIDLVRFAHRHENSLDPVASLCATSAHNRQKVLFTLLDVFDALGRVASRQGPGGAGEPLGVPANATGRYDYYAYLVLASTVAFRGAQSRDIYIAYDLERDPRDVCFRLQGGNILGADFTTNTIVIPAATIRAALDRAAP